MPSIDWLMVGSPISCFFTFPRRIGTSIGMFLTSPTWPSLPGLLACCMTPCERTAPQKRPDPPQECATIRRFHVGFRISTMRLTNIFGASAVFGLAVGIAALLVPASARAADDEDSIDKKVMRGIMEGLGLKRDGEEMINYRERSPLVIPPSRELPPPERSDAVTANNPAWPKDPDVERRKAQAAMEKSRNVSVEREREQNPLRPDQLTPGGRPKKKQARKDDG